MSFDATKYTQSPWLHGVDLPPGQPIELTIANAREHTFTDGTVRPVIGFLECDPEMSLNKTQVQTLVSLFGANADAWKGQRVTLTAVPTQLGKPTIMLARAAAPTMPTLNGQPMAAAPTQQPAAPLGVGAVGVQFRQPG